MHFLRLLLSTFIFWAVATGDTTGHATASELKFASTHTAHMVLQRQQSIVVSGYGRGGENVKVSLGAQIRLAEMTADGRWSVSFDPMNAGGPYKLQVDDGTDQVTLDDILIGDVWVCAGQSNMQMGLGEVDGGVAAIAAASPDLPVRLLSVPKSAVKEPQSELRATWQHCTPDSLQKFSAVAWFFADHVRQDAEFSNVPIGLIDCSFGGTAIEAWTPAGTLPNIPAEQLSKSMFGISAAHLFNGMVSPLLSYRVKGVLWYQGESNASAATVYSSLLTNMIAQWRHQWNQPELPFLVVQLPAYEGRANGLDFGWLREAQAKACDESPRAWLAVTYDTTDGFDLHPREKEPIGRRLALLARREVDGQDIVAAGAVMQEVSFGANRVVVTFDQELATPPDGVIRGFEVAGVGESSDSPGEFRYVDGTVDGCRVLLDASEVTAPQTLRFAWGAIPNANLTNEAGLPAAPFRTDDREPESLAFEPLPTAYRIETPTYSLEMGRGGTIASLVIGRKQFLSHEPGGGTRIPGFFGPRNLAHTHPIGPRRMAVADSVARLEINAEPSSMRWTVTNSDKNPIEFQIVLDPQVEVSTDGSTVTVSRGRARLEIAPVTQAKTEHTLVVPIPGHGSVEIRCRISTSQ